MKTSQYSNANNQLRISEVSPMHMEQYERRHLEQFYQSKKDELLCWGVEPTYLDSEFYAILEKSDQGNSGFWM